MSPRTTPQRPHTKPDQDHDLTTVEADRRRWLTRAGTLRLAVLGGCGGGGSASSATDSGGTTSTGSTPSGTATSGDWTLKQRARADWTNGKADWNGVSRLALDNVTAGSTLVMCVWGYQSDDTDGFRLPVDSQGQAVRVAADGGVVPSYRARSAAWVLHNATAGRHAWSNLPALGTGGDGVAVLMEFHRDVGGPTSQVVDQATPFTLLASSGSRTTGSVTLAGPLAAGDLLVACGFEEEANTGSSNTSFTHTPAEWLSVAVQNESTLNIAGEVCWRSAPSTAAQTVTWQWSITGAQDPLYFRGLAIALR